MSGQIRITKTPKLEEILKTLGKMFPALSENEIVKLTISDFFTKHTVDENGLTPKEARNLKASIAEADRGEVEGPFENTDDFFATLKT